MPSVLYLLCNKSLHKRDLYVSKQNICPQYNYFINTIIMNTLRKCFTLLRWGGGGG